MKVSSVHYWTHMGIITFLTSTSHWVMGNVFNVPSTDLNSFSAGERQKGSFRVSTPTTNSTSGSWRKESRQCYTTVITIWRKWEEEGCSEKSTKKEEEEVMSFFPSSLENQIIFLIVNLMLARCSYLSVVVGLIKKKFNHLTRENTEIYQYQYQTYHFSQPVSTDTWHL